MGLFCKKTIEIVSPLNGKIIPTKDIKDDTFAQNMLGETIGIVPSEGNVVSPICGKITAFYPTGHAFCVEHKKGFSVLVHIGIDTVNINKDKKDGEELIAFKPLVKEGDTVSCGSAVVEVDWKEIKKHKYDTTTSVILIPGDETFKLNYDQNTKKDIKQNEVISQISK